jgi:UrcA family protein
MNTRTMSTPARLVTTFALLAALLPPAHAGSGTSTVVRIGDLDLARPAGVAALHDRLTAAAARVCGDVPADLARAAMVRSCRAHALADALAAVARPTPAAQVAQITVR